MLRDAPNITWTKVAISPSELAFYKPQSKDRTCLLSPPKSASKSEPYAGPMTVTLLVKFLNEKCNAYCTAHGMPACFMLTYCRSFTYWKRMETVPDLGFWISQHSFSNSCCALDPM